MVPDLLHERHQRHLTDPIDYNGARWVAIMMSVILADKIVQLAVLFFRLFSWNLQLRLLTNLRCRCEYSLRHNISFANMHTNNHKRADTFKIYSLVIKSDFDERISLRLFIVGYMGLEREKRHVEKGI